jgi:hypothetical protein
MTIEESPDGLQGSEKCLELFTTVVTAIQMVLHQR